MAMIDALKALEAKCLERQQELDAARESNRRLLRELEQAKNERDQARAEVDNLNAALANGRRFD